MRTLHPSFRRLFLPALTVILLFSSTSNAVFFKKMTSAMPNYPLFLMQVSVIAYIPLCAAVVAALAMWTNAISEESTEFPKRRFFVISALETVARFFSTTGGTHTRGTTQTLLGQMQIPMTMGLSVVFLSTRYSRLHGLAAVFILCGVAVVLIPTIMGQSPNSVASATSDVLEYNVLYFVGSLPLALSNVYMEHAFSSQKPNVFYSLFFMASFSLLLGFLSVPLTALTPQPVPLPALISTFTNGSRCLAGVNSVVESCIPPQNPAILIPALSAIDSMLTPSSVAASSLALSNAAHPRLPPCDNCFRAWLPVLGFILCNTVMNVTTILFLQTAPAALLAAVSALRLPLGNVAFCMTAVMGDDAQEVRAADVAGLIVILVGVVVFRGAGAGRKSGRDVEGCSGVQGKGYTAIEEGAC